MLDNTFEHNRQLEKMLKRMTDPEEIAKRKWQKQEEKQLEITKERFSL